MKKKTLSIAAPLVFLAAVAVFVYSLAAPSSAPLAPRKSPALSGPSLTGGAIALSDLAGKVVLVDFWATWCEPCQEEAPALVALRDRLAPKGFEILGVSMDEDGAKAVRRFTAKHPISYPIMLNGGEDPPPGWSVPGLPTAFLVGRDGKVIKRWLGEKDLDEVARDIEAALSAKQP